MCLRSGSGRMGCGSDDLIVLIGGVIAMTISLASILAH